MARNKYPEITVNRILDTSLKLFLEKGYEKTTIQDIIDDLGDLTKGAIYHHFKSKEDIINAVTSRMFTESNFIGDIVLRDDLNGLEKVQQFFLVCMSDQSQEFVINTAPSLLKNPKFLVNHINESMNVMPKLIQPFIEEGINDGSITATSPKELSEIVMMLINIWLNPIIFSLTVDEFNEKISYLKGLFENIGIPILNEEIIKNIQQYSKVIK